MVRIYSLAKDGETYLSENFRAKEFACKDGSEDVLISDELVTLLQKIRDHFNAPITINSAYRTEAYNKKIGGATYSQHVKGKAADIVVQGATPEQVAQYAEYLQPNSGGIGLYNSFTHVDVRDNRSRWNSTSGKEVAVQGFPGYVEEVEPETHWYDEDMAWAKENGITDGTNPESGATRAEVWAMLRRLYNLVK